MGDKRHSRQGHVSLSLPTYLKLKAYCEMNNVTMAEIVEKRVNEYLDAQPEDLLGPEEASP